MGNTCSQCSRNSEADTEFGGNLSCQCRLHGLHSPVTQACVDFSPNKTVNPKESTLLHDQFTDSRHMYKHEESFNANSLVFFVIISVALVLIPFALTTIPQMIASLQPVLDTKITVTSDTIGSLLLPLVTMVIMMSVLVRVFNSRDRY